MSNNIYKYKIRYTNILGGSSSINENQEANNNQSNKDFKSVQFKHYDEWPKDSLEWTSQITYEFIKDLIWNENGEGKIIPLNELKFILNEDFSNDISINYTYFRFQAFIDESLNDFFLHDFEYLDYEQNNLGSENIQFKNKDMWPINASEWTSQNTYKFLKYLIWDENGEGKIIPLNKIKINKNYPYDFIINNTKFNNSAFTLESRKKYRKMSDNRNQIVNENFDVSPSKRNNNEVAGKEINNVSKNTDDNVGAF